jgi:hypothetical protein
VAWINRVRVYRCIFQTTSLHCPQHVHGTLYTITHFSIRFPAFSAIVRTNHLVYTVFHLLLIFDWVVYTFLTMKLTHSLALLVTAALTLPSTVADFHVTQVHGSPTSLVACPSDYFTCDCLSTDDRGAQIVVNGNEVTSLPSNFFSTGRRFCGVQQLDFYYRSDTGIWQFYVNNGDGSLQGECYSNTASGSCWEPQEIPATLSWVDKLVCYSYICNPTLDNPIFVPK